MVRFPKGGCDCVAVFKPCVAVIQCPVAPGGAGDMLVENCAFEVGAIKMKAATMSAMS